MDCCKLEKLPVFIYLLWVWCCIHIKAASQSLKPGETLNANATSDLCSEKLKYCMGFSYYANHDLYCLSIYANTNYGWQVWVANRDQSVDPDSAVLSLNHSGVLKIESQDGEPIILYSSPSPMSPPFVATLLDTGNFVLQQSHPNGSTRMLWQSFDYPTDTLLPGMKLGVDRKAGRNWSLVSWLNRNNPTTGPFKLEWEPTRNEMVIRRHGQVCWTSGKLNRKNRFKHITVEDDYEIVSNDTTQEYYVTLSTTNKEFTFWSLQETGQLINRREGSDVARADMCYGYNTEGGCQRWEDIPTCRHPGDVFEEVQGYPNPNADISEETNKSYGISDCQASCWTNCSCVAYESLFYNGTGCQFYHWNLTEGANIVKNGRRFFLLVSTKHKSTKKWIWKGAAIATALLIICSSILCLAIHKRKHAHQYMRRKDIEIETQGSIAPNKSSGIRDLEDDLKKGHDLKVFSYTLVMEATNGFSSENKLGQGGFGPVYKGILSTGQEVAVKRLSKTSGQGIIEFKNEVTLVYELQHMNLVQLLGCCIHGEERILIYEYMPNRSLDFFIFDCTKSNLLDWKKRFNIIEGISQGLLYLHKYSRVKVIHRDLKASNILLDENMNPKIADFGMARMFTQHESAPNTERIVGTYGYMSPEYAMEGIFSTKSDVYSFGVLLLEIVSGKRNNTFYDANRPLNLIGHAWQLWNEGMYLKLMDASLNDTFDPDQVQRCIHVGLLCVEQYPNDRPNMFDVISMLTNKSVAVAVPRRPAFYVGREIFKGESSSKSKETPYIGSIVENDSTIVEAR